MKIFNLTLTRAKMANTGDDVSVDVSDDASTDVDDNIHPRILERNVKVGDYILITNIKKLGPAERRIFYVAKITSSHIHIHPQSRPQQLSTIYPHHNSGPRDANWLFGDNTKPEHDHMGKINYLCTWGEDPAFDNIQLFSQDDETITDYRQIKELVIDFAKNMEKVMAGPRIIYRLRQTTARGYVYRGDRPYFKAKTRIGALVSYMNWLDTQQITDMDTHMWDQLNPRDLSIWEHTHDGVFSIVRLVDSLLKNNDLFKSYQDEREVIEFPGPMDNLIKSAAKQ